MRRKYPALSVFIVCCVLLVWFDCQEETAALAESKPAVQESKPAIVASKLMVSEAKPAVVKLKSESPVSEPVISPAKTETAPEANEPEPRIEIEKSSHDFGEVGASTKNTYEFKFTNVGTAVLKIKKVQSTCGCMVPELQKKEYAPGESGVVKVTFSAPARKGVSRKTLYIHSNDKKNPRAKLTITARVAPKVDYKPRKLNLSLKEENGGCPDIVLRSLDNRLFLIQGIKSSSNVITIDYDGSKRAKEFVLKPKVDMEKIRKRMRGNVEIKLSHPQCKEVSISYHMLSEFKLDPPTFIILKAEPQKPVSKKLSVLSNYSEDFEIESTRSKDGMIKVLSREKSGNGYGFELEITPPPIKDDVNKFTDVFYVKIKGAEELRIVCLGFYSNKENELSPLN